MKNPAECVREFFEQQGWQYDHDPSERRYRSQLTGKNGRWSFWIRLRSEDEDRRILVESQLPAIVPEDRRAACADLLNRINASMELSCFVVEPDTGAVRSRTCMPVDPDHVSPEAMEDLIITHLVATDEFFAPIMRLVYAGQSPEEALRPETPAANPASRFELN
jgi:hypothetical protein